MAQERPSNFDWVTARSECSAAKMFELLYLEARKNVETRNKAMSAESHFEIANSDGIFTVIRRGRFGGVAGVRVLLLGDEISVETQALGDMKFTATLTLNNDAECRLLVDGEQLDRWQVLRRALEPLLFGQF